MRIAYADPPYIGQAHRYGRREVLWDRLVRALDRFDGWALSCNPADLRHVFPLCPEKVRVAAYCKTFAVGHLPGARYAWEPVLFRSCRQGKRVARFDWEAFCPTRDGFFGSKPPEFCAWMFELLGAEPEDEFHDLFRGSGAVSRAWRQWSGGRAAKSCGRLEAGVAPLFQGLTP